MQKLEQLYSTAFPSKRSGSLYTSFSYPTKISPEVIAVFIASHTNPGDNILDAFGGSGTTGLATLLCANPTEEVKDIAEQMNAPVKWGPRKAHIYEISTLGAFISDNMCNPPEPELFKEEAQKLINKVKEKYGWFYEAKDPDGNKGTIRHLIWSEVLKCNNCNQETSYWDSAVNFNPLSLSDKFECPECGFVSNFNEVERVKETYYDDVLNKTLSRKKRVIKRVYGITGSNRWVRDFNQQDSNKYNEIINSNFSLNIPIKSIDWGDLYRSGYHYGISHLHHFYSKRNLYIIAALFDEIKKAPAEVQEALKLLVLSYNATHSTLMTRAVVKSKQKDFVLTGAQPGVLYISNLPIEKNILLGLERKINTFYKSFTTVYKSKSEVNVYNKSCTNMDDIEDQSIDYVFTDPPFGDYIPYSEVNFLNEGWLGAQTDKNNEAIISNSQGKGVFEYQSLISEAFKEMSRIINKNGHITVVFHSAKSEVWRALQKSYRDAGLKVELSSVLDKLQGSFKQVTSKVSVKGDPLLLLKKVESTKNQNMQLSIEFDIDETIQELISHSRKAGEEPTPQRLYSRFVNFYLENDYEVPINADEFYKRVGKILRGTTQ